MYQKIARPRMRKNPKKLKTTFFIILSLIPVLDLASSSSSWPTYLLKGYDSKENHRKQDQALRPFTKSLIRTIALSYRPETTTKHYSRTLGVAALSNKVCAVLLLEFCQRDYAGSLTSSQRTWGTCSPPIICGNARSLTARPRSHRHG